MKNSLIYLVFLSFSTTGFTQTEQINNIKKLFRYSNKLTLGTDLAQPFLLGGLNLNVTFTTNRWIFNYSHDIGLEIPDFIKSDEREDLNAE